MNTRIMSEIALRPTVNTQGLFYYCRLAIGRHLTRQRCTPISMKDDITDRVRYIVDRQKYPNGLSCATVDITHIPDLDEEGLAGDEVSINNEKDDENIPANELILEDENEVNVFNNDAYQDTVGNSGDVSIDYEISTIIMICILNLMIKQECMIQIRITNQMMMLLLT